MVSAEILNMGTTIYPNVPVARPAGQPWPVDEHTIGVDEIFARQIDNEFAAGVRAVVHGPATVVSAQSGEAAPSAIANAMPTLDELRERTLVQAMGPRQRGGAAVDQAAGRGRPPTGAVYN